MQKKYSKHFIYNWLKEDLFGEYSLHKPESALGHVILKKIWVYMTTNWKTYRRGLLTRRSSLIKREQQVLSQLLYNIRFKFQLQSFYYKKITSFNLKNPCHQSSIEKFWKACYKKNRVFLFIPKATLLPSSSTRARAISSGRFKSFCSPRKLYRTRASLYFIKNRKKWRFTNKFFKNNFFPFLKKRKYRTRYPRFVSKGLLLLRARRYYVTPMKRLDFKSTVKPTLYLRSWNAFVRSTKWGLNKILWRTKKTRFSNRRGTKFIPRFRFIGVFKPRKRLVKRGEVKAVLNFRLLHYFGLLNTSAELPTLFKKYVYSAKNFSLPAVSRIEFQTSTAVLRAGFLENGYIATALIKRNAFLVNGVPVNSNSVLNVWDIVAVSKPIWWLVYSRFIHFFSRITARHYSGLSHPNFSNLFVLRNLKKSNYLRRRFFITRKVRRKLKLPWGRRVVLPTVVRHFLSSRNYIFSTPPSYMEVSFKLFLIVLWRLVLNPTEVNRPFNLKSLRSMLYNKKKASKTPFQIEVGVGRV